MLYKFVYQILIRDIPHMGRVDNNLGQDRLADIADQQAFDCTTFVWKS